MGAWKRSRRRGSPADRERRRIGINVIALLVIPATAALIVAHNYHLGVPATLISLLLGGGAPAGLYMTWETIRQASKSGEKEPGSVEDDADKLAKIVGDQWSEEIKKRRFNDPSRHLTVSWTAARQSLTVSWDELVALGARGPGREAHAQPEKWAASPEGLTGFENELPAVLERVPTGWLVVLGGPGSGKSMLMLRLVVDLLELRKKKKGEPVPVLVPMTSWDPESHTLYEWLEEQLPIDYPALDTMVPAGDGGESSRIAALLADQMIVPILDGLDEMPPGARVLAIDRLNEAFSGPGYPLRLVMTSRVEDYGDAVSWNRLVGAAAVELHPLDPDLVSAYLANRNEKGPWALVLEALKEREHPVAKTLRIPLYASLASAIYNPHDYNPGRRRQDPAELCDRKKFPTQQALEEHLLDTFIPAVYRGNRRPAPGDEEEHPPAERWLSFLAQYMTSRHDDHTNLQWWDLKGLAPVWLVPGIVAVICGVGVGIAAGTGTHVGVGIGIGFGIGMLIALAIGLGTRYAMYLRDRARYQELYENRRPGPGMAGGLIGATVGGIAAGVAGKYGIGHEASLFSGLPEGLGIGIGAGASTRFPGGLIGGLLGSFAGGCLAAVGVGLPAALVNGAGVGLAVAFVVEYRGRRMPAKRRPKWEREVGIVGGLVIGVVIGLIAWREEGIAAGIVAAVLIGAAAAVPFGLRHTQEDLDYVPSPGAALSRDVSAFRLTALSAGLAAGIAGFIGGSLSSISEVKEKMSLPALVGDGLGIGLASALVIGLTFGFYHAASARFRIISWWLALRGKTPWRLQRFLADAYERSVLRQAGARYQFRHETLQRRLAARITEASRQRQRGGDRSPSGAMPQQAAPGPASATAQLDQSLPDTS